MRAVVLPVLVALALTACDDKADASASSDAKKEDKAGDDKKADAKKADAKEADDKKADAEPSKADASAMKSVNIPLGDGDLDKVLAEQIALAKAANLTPFIEIWATWCPPCKALEASMDDPQIQKAFAGVYLIRLDSDVWGEKLKAGGFDNSSIPVFFEIDDAGKPTGRSINGGAWGEDIPSNMAPPLDAFFHGTKS